VTQKYNVIARLAKQAVAIRSPFTFWYYGFPRSFHSLGMTVPAPCHLSSQKATEAAAATFSESTPWHMGIITV